MGRWDALSIHSNGSTSLNYSYCFFCGTDWSWANRCRSFDRKKLVSNDPSLARSLTFLVAFVWLYLLSVFLLFSVWVCVYDCVVLLFWFVWISILTRSNSPTKHNSQLASRVWTTTTTTTRTKFRVCRHRPSNYFNRQSLAGCWFQAKSLQKKRRKNFFSEFFEFLFFERRKSKKKLFDNNERTKHENLFLHSLSLRSENLGLAG